MHFVLLDDLLLVARRRQRRTGGGGRLVADRCWNIPNLVLQDVKDSAGRSTYARSEHKITVFSHRSDKCCETSTSQRNPCLPYGARQR